MGNLTYSAAYIPRLCQIIIDKDYRYLEICDKSNKVMNSFTCDNAEELAQTLQAEINGITGGEFILYASENKKLQTKGICVPMNITNMVTNTVAIAGKSSDSDIKMQFELYKMQVQHDKQLAEIAASVAPSEEEEESEYPEIDRWLNHPIIGPIITPILTTRKDQVISYIAGVLDNAIGYDANSQAQIAGTPAEEKVKEILGKLQYDMIMSALADRLEKDPKGTIAKIQQIFAA
jgi:hypothetical protein